MQVTINGEAKTIPDSITAAALIQELDLAGKRIAIEVNQTIIPRSKLDNHQIQPGDRVEIVHAIGGG